MKWLRKVIKKWLNTRDHELIARRETSYNLSVDPLRINIYRATGGIVVETMFYDRTKDVSNERLHVITSDQDIGECLSHIITMESLRNS